jgi:hypothetical protein
MALASQEVETGRSLFKANPGKKLTETLSQK